MKRPEGITFGGELNGEHKLSCEVCIVGSGPAGAVAADELTRAGRDVVLVEEGPVPQPAQTMTPREVVTDYYRDMGLTATHWPVQIPVFAGRVFGGTSVINSGTALPTPQRAFDEWAEDLGVEFDRERWRGIEERILEDLSVSVCPPELMSASNRLFEQGLAVLGLTGGERLPRSERGCDGAGRCCFVCPREAKQSVDLNLLQRAMGQGLRTYVETEAAALYRSGRQITGLMCKTPAGGRVVIKAKQYVLAMGALVTPLFLLSNGFRRSYRQIGCNLSIHPASKVFAEMPEPVHAWTGVPQAYRYNHPEHPDVHFEGVFLPPSMGAISIPFLGRDLAQWMGMYDRLAGFGFFLSDSSFGRILRLPGLGPFTWYRLTFRDMDNYCFALKLIARAYFAVGAQRVLLPLLDPRNVYTSAQQLERGFPSTDFKPSQALAMAFHPLGTCRFSKDPDNGVVDPVGRCHQHDNLYICDGSAIPGPLHANPQITIMTFAKTVCDHLTS